MPKRNRNDRHKPEPNLKSWLSAILLLLFAQAFTCQAFTETPVILVSGLDESENITPYIKFIRDTQGILEPENITQPHIKNHFTQATEKTLQTGFTSHPLWLKFGLSNELEHQFPVLLEISQMNIRKLEIYRENASNELSLYFRPNPASLNATGVLLQHYAYPVYLAPGEESIFYIRLESDYPVNTQLVLHPGTSPGSGMPDYLFTGLMMGALVVIIFSCLHLYFRKREVPALYFCLLSGLLLLYIILSFEGPRRLLSELHLTTHLDALSVLVSALLITLHTETSIPDEHLLNERRQILAVIKLLSLPLLLLISFTSTQIMIIFSLIYGLLTLVYLTFLVSSSYARGGKTGWLLCGFTVLCIVGLIVSLVSFNLVSMAMPSMWFSVLACTWFILCLYAGILHSNAVTENQKPDSPQAPDTQTISREDYISQFSHQVRTPLSGILGMTELLQDSSLSPNQQNYLTTIRSSAHSLVNLVNEVVDGIRLETGTIIINKNPFNPAKMLEQCLEVFRAETSEREIELIINCSPSVPEFITSDEARIRQIFTSAINAVLKKSHASEIVVSMTKDPENPLLLTEISGLEGYEDASQHDSPPLPDNMKTAEKLVTLLGGEAYVDRNNRSHWSIFISLPFEESDETGTFKRRYDLENLKLLVVDDNPTATKVIVEQARHAGADVTGVESAKQALAIAKSQASLGNPFDIIIVDQEMPGMSGLELTARLKEEPLIGENVIIIMLTGHSIAQTSESVRNAGIRRILTKPVSGETLLNTISEELDYNTRLFEQAMKAPERSVEELSNEPVRILVAEDHRLSQKVVRGMLNRLGTEFRLVDNGRDAVDAFISEQWDLVLMDCEMPEMNGYEASRAIRLWEQKNNKTHTPIIALTAHIQDRNEKLSREAGMDGYINKPVELVELKRLVTNLTGKRTSELAEQP